MSFEAWGHSAQTSLLLQPTQFLDQCALVGVKTTAVRRAQTVHTAALEEDHFLLKPNPWFTRCLLRVHEAAQRPWIGLSVEMEREAASLDEAGTGGGGIWSLSWHPIHPSKSSLEWVHNIPQSWKAGGGVLHQMIMEGRSAQPAVPGGGGGQHLWLKLIPTGKFCGGKNSFGPKFVFRGLRRRQHPLLHKPKGLARVPSSLPHCLLECFLRHDGWCGCLDLLVLLASSQATARYRVCWYRQPPCVRYSRAGNTSIPAFLAQWPWSSLLVVVSAELIILRCRQASPAPLMREGTMYNTPWSTFRRLLLSGTTTF